MIKITARGRTQEFEGVDPDGRAYCLSLRQWFHVGELLNQLVATGTAWEIDFSRADEAEAIEWGRHDLAARCLRAVLEGRTVFFMNREYATMEEMGELEDAIAGSGLMVRVDSDDESGLHIGAHGPEPAKN